MNQKQHVHRSINPPPFHPFACILALFISLWMWSRLLWKGTFNPDDDSRWHALWSLGGNPHPSNAVSPGRSCLSWRLGTAAPGEGHPAVGERMLKLQEEPWLGSCSHGCCRRILQWTRFWQWTNHLSSGWMEFSKSGSRPLPAIDVEILFS